MKLLDLVDSSNETRVKLTPENKDDLFTIYQIIDPNDEIIIKKQFKQSDSDKSDLLSMRLKIISFEFDIKDEYLRYKAITVPMGGNQKTDYPIGKFISFNIVYNHVITIFKDEDNKLNKYAKKLINESIEDNFEIGAIVLQDGIAHICELNSLSVVMRQKVSVNSKKKKTTENEVETQEFYQVIYDSMLNQLSLNDLKCFLICSPGFYAETLFKFIEKKATETNNTDILNNLNIFVVAHCSNGYLQGIDEVLRNPKYTEVIGDTKLIKDVKLFGEFMEHLNLDDSFAWYGEFEIFKAVEQDAVETLLMTDTMMKSNDIHKRERYMDLIETVENNGGKVVIFSSLNGTGEELNKLDGIACILKYALPNLDEDYDENDEKEKEEEEN
ncbi:hypothetical protein KAFR_0I02320 [Kazachstania africana CBS 2517]|uniref:Protein DOM34 homolog n=1 Tax=Kazachstania africana (strain ATCC 22294 / BCRC 22015 / CBS 2517 / CECT 1963 / NBRC 1671 / NRRL Y-8276) TaxID=1071382 RepID=H2B061_KAZAF|nr:hypothetical protein KAFR_0I02320 [Kazachstania africana CBS 2517]CCF60011.1 hypothetical protein KAFR_0I02320 [Kazachstania africana CBS 2517]